MKREGRVIEPFDHSLIEEPMLAPIPVPYYARLAQADNDKQELMAKRLQLISCLRAVQESKLGEEMGSVM